MKIAFIGDVVGKAGRQALAAVFPNFKSKNAIDLAIANLENAAGGFGITEKALSELEDAGVDFFTSGNHIWDKREGVKLLDGQSNIVRPANYPGNAPGKGHRVIYVDDTPVLILNIQGRVFMPPIDCPFRVADRCLEEAGELCRIKIVDVHAEATSEKIAMGWYLDGRVSLVVGTHTHVPTSDARILPGGTGYITDVGMTGAYDSVLGIAKDAVLDRFLHMRPVRFEVAKKDVRCDMVIVEIDKRSGRTASIEQIQVRVGE